MIIDPGLRYFLKAKKLNYHECVNAFLKHQNITKFSAKNYTRAINYINSNWNPFASFVDNKLKVKEISGKRVKLSHYDEMLRERAERNKAAQEQRYLARLEYNSYVFADEEIDMLKVVENHGIGVIDSYIVKHNISRLKSEHKWRNKRLQFLPQIHTLIYALVTPDMILEYNVEYQAKKLEKERKHYEVQAAHHLKYL